MDYMKFETAFTYEKAKETIEAITLVGLIGHFTGYRPPDNDEETENAMVALDSVINDCVKVVLEQTGKEEIHEMIESLNDGMDVFKEELINVMKRLETM